MPSHSLLLAISLAHPEACLCLCSCTGCFHCANVRFLPHAAHAWLLLLLSMSVHICQNLLHTAAL